MDNVAFSRFLGRVTSSHLVTYFVTGILAYSLLDYATLFQSEGFSCLMRPLGSRWIAAGPALQVIRGLIFALALYPFRSVFLADRRGWLKLWGLLLGLAIFSTAGAAPGSVEGMIYTKIPVTAQLRGTTRDPPSDARLFGPAHRLASAPAQGVGGGHGNVDGAGDADERGGRVSLAHGGPQVEAIS